MFTRCSGIDNHDFPEVSGHVMLIPAIHSLGRRVVLSASR